MFFVLSGFLISGQLFGTIANGGKMLYRSQINQLTDLIRKNDNIKTVMYEDKKYNELIDNKLVFVLILFSLSLEWFIRKREGEI